MADYRFEELGKHYRVGKTLCKWRPQWDIFVSWIDQGSKVLDLGCGDGVLGEMLIKQKKCKVFGTEPDKMAVKESQRRGIKAILHDANFKLPYKDKSFDYVICNEVIQLLNNPELALSECLRVGKVAIIEFPNFGFGFYRLEMLFGNFPKKALFGYTPFNSCQIRFFSYSEFMRLKVMRNVKVIKQVFINWRNRKISILAKINPNFFGRSCILMITSKR